jgi:hypothetical protein
MRQVRNAHKIFGPVKFREQVTRETYALIRLNRMSLVVDRSQLTEIYKSGQ